jgi:hypothetical protein
MIAGERPKHEGRDLGRRRLSIAVADNLRGIDRVDP